MTRGPPGQSGQHLLMLRYLSCFAQKPLIHNQGTASAAPLNDVLHHGLRKVQVGGGQPVLTQKLRQQVHARNVRLLLLS